MAVSDAAISLYPGKEWVSLSNRDGPAACEARDYTCLVAQYFSCKAFKNLVKALWYRVRLLILGRHIYFDGVQRQ
jgi:hypothetical protein